jgi:hypothetical protein
MTRSHDPQPTPGRGLGSLARVVLYAGVVALAFAGAALAGSAVDPDVDGDTSSAHSEDGEKGKEMKSHSTSQQAAVKGLAQSEGGLRLVVDDDHVATSRRLGFRIVDDEGATVRDFDVEHDRRMHLIVVRRDLSGFQHLHPRQTADGGWEVPLRLADAGTYRLFADFSTGGEAHTLGVDMNVDGPFEAQTVPDPASSTVTDSGYEVRLAEQGGEVRFTVFKDGVRVRDIEPYLGARGHLVALREGDLAFLHVHPESEQVEGSDIRFAVEYPSEGRYRLFLQFKVDGRVHTAAFTREVGDTNGH